MKGTFFLRPLEFSLRVDGESWKQGESVAGALTIKNHGSEAAPLSSIAVHLSRGGLKKVHDKAQGAFDILKSFKEPTGGTLAPGAAVTFDWKFETDRNFPITDSASSPFLLYGNGESNGHIQLTFVAEPLIQEFLKAITIHFRFVVRSQKSNKDGVMIRLDPPDSKAFAALEELAVQAWFEGEKLLLTYFFEIKKMEPTPGKTAVEKKKIKFDQELAPETYRLPSGRYNPDGIEAAIQEALSQVESKVLF